jgi:YfiH family protein
MSNRVCAVMTADCLPVLLCSTDGSRVAAVHGGWRGLASGILRVAVDRMGSGPIMAWLGPAIGPEAFEVGAEVREAFIGTEDSLSDAFRPAGGSKWTADIYEIARQQLAALGVKECYGGEYCTYGDPDRFFSYRRDGVTGRMATLIWKV